MILISVIIGSCETRQEIKGTFFKIKVPKGNADVPEFREYCNMDLLNGEHETNAVKCAFIGDYENAVYQATLDATTLDQQTFIEVSDLLPSYKELDSILNNTSELSDEWFQANMIKSMLKMPKNLESYFKNTRRTEAISFIIKQAIEYHFTLINEAHYCSQHREFTSDLLQPLWDSGYRYLALETASAEDAELNMRGYPIKASGYYTKDSNFSNLIRKALKLGYKIIPYETEVGHHGSDRDLDQATNLLKRTWGIDKVGKVLVHAGYSHINEHGDQYYRPMGYYLKKQLNQDILTVDQVNMTHLRDDNKQNDYYKYVNSSYELREPTIILDSLNRSVVQPLLLNLVDIQVYHPPTNFINGRPDWLVKGRKLVKMPKYVYEYPGCWLRVIKRDENENAIPVDQFVIRENAAIVLEEDGEFIIEIIDCDGHIVELLDFNTTF